MIKLAALVATLSLAGCTMASEVYGPDGEPALLIACGAGTPISNCYDRAAQECPAGYVTLDERRGFNRAEIRVRCK